MSGDILLAKLMLMAAITGITRYNIQYLRLQIKIFGYQDKKNEITKAFVSIKIYERFSFIFDRINVRAKLKSND